MFTSDAKKFNILDHVENLAPAKGKDRYICPVCGNDNLTIAASGKYQCWNGCDCKDIREAIAPWEPGKKNSSIVNINSARRKKNANPKQVSLPESIQIAKADGVEIKPPATTNTEWRDGSVRIQERFDYAGDKWVVRHQRLDANGERLDKKRYTQHHSIDGVEQFREKYEDGTPKKVPFKGEGQWPAYREAEALEALRNGGNCLLVVEGEPCTEVGWHLGLATITFQGSGWSFHEGGEGDALLKRLKSVAPEAGLICWPDKDKTGFDKARKLKEACEALGIWCVQLDPEGFDVPEKGDVVDATANLGSDEVRRIIEKQLQEIIGSYQPEPEQEADYGGDGGDGSNGGGFPATKLAAQFAMVRAVLGDHLRWNELLMQIELDGEALDTDFARLKLALDVGVEMSESDAIACLTTIAKESSYHPVRDYLNDCHARYAADTGILNGIAERYFGAVNVLHQSYLVKHLIASCKRAFEPGEKNDAILVLQSQKQGINKSSFLKILHGKDYFTDSMQGLDRDGLMVANQYWCIEIAEIDGIFSKKENAELKAFLSRDTDTFRLPYGRKSKKYPRGFVLAGTTNDGEFLRDETGNRRFMVLPVTLPKIPLDLLKEERDRIWGAAMALYRAGVAHWLGDEEMALQNSANLQFSMADPWEDIIFPAIEGQNFIATQHIFEKILGIEPSKQSRKESLRIKSLMLKAGWKSARRRVGEGHPVRGYEAPVPDKPPVPDESNYVAQPEPLQHKDCATVPDVPDKNKTFQNEIALASDTATESAIVENLKIDDLSGTSGTFQPGQGFQPVPDTADISGTERSTPQEEIEEAITWIEEAIEEDKPLLAVEASDKLAALGTQYKEEAKGEEWVAMRQAIKQHFAPERWDRFLALKEEGRKLGEEIAAEFDVSADPNQLSLDLNLPAQPPQKYPDHYDLGY